MAEGKQSLLAIFASKRHRSCYVRRTTKYDYGRSNFAPQNVKKLNANIYSTALSGIKFKVAHKRSTKGKWSVSEATQKKRIVKFLEELKRQSRDKRKICKMLKLLKPRSCLFQSPVT